MRIVRLGESFTFDFRSEYIGARSPAIAAAVAKSRSDSSFWSWSDDPSPVFILENWTKWTLRLVPENRRDGVIQVKPQSYVTLDNQVVRK